MKDRKLITLMHFGHVINRYDFVDVIVRFADRTKYKLVACSIWSEAHIKDPEFHKIGVPHERMGLGHGKVDYVKAIFKLVSLLKKHKVDMLHTHHFYEAIIGTIASKIVGNVKVVMGRHYHDELYLTTKGFKLSFYLGLESFFNKNVAAIVSPSSQITELLLKQGVDRGKIFNVPYGFEFDSPRYKLYSFEEREQIREELDLKSFFAVGNFGRHHPIKGQKYLLQAFAIFIQKYPDSILVMVGDGPIHDDLIQYANELKIINKVKFLGWRKDADRIMMAMDAIVHPTFQEAFPQLMIEAMALERPLLITPVSGASDQVTHLDTGYLLPFKDSDGIVKGMEWLVENKEVACLLGKNARKHVLSNLDISKVILQYENVYESIS